MKSRGLSLIEVLISAGIAVVVGTLLVTIIINSAGLFTKQSSKLSQGLNTNDALSKIRESIKEANSVAASFSIYTSGVTQLVLSVPSIDSSNNIISNTFDYYIFFKDANFLRFKTFPNAASVKKAQDQIFSNSLDSLNFQYFDSASPPLEVTPGSANKVRVTLSLKQKNGSLVEVKTSTSEASLRNN